MTWYKYDKDYNPIRQDLNHRDHNFGDKFAEYDKWLRANKIIKQEEIAGMFLSTVFLGLDHGIGIKEAEPPVLWETMLFGEHHGDVHGEWRYQSYKEAIEGHNAVKKRIEAKVKADLESRKTK